MGPPLPLPLLLSLLLQVELLLGIPHFLCNGVESSLHSLPCMQRGCASQLGQAGWQAACQAGDRAPSLLLLPQAPGAALILFNQSSLELCSHRGHTRHDTRRDIPLTSEGRHQKHAQPVCRAVALYRSLWHCQLLFRLPGWGAALCCRLAASSWGQRHVPLLRVLAGSQRDVPPVLLLLVLARLPLQPPWRRLCCACFPSRAGVLALAQRQPFCLGWRAAGSVRRGADRPADCHRAAASAAGTVGAATSMRRLPRAAAGPRRGSRWPGSGQRCHSCKG